MSNIIVRDAGNHVSIEENSTLLLLNTVDSGLYRIEPITRKLLILIKKYSIDTAKSLIKEEDIDNVAEEKIAELRENKFLDSQARFSPPETVPMTVASLNVSHDCNLNCRYCYGGGGTYTGEPCYMSKEIGCISVPYWLYASYKSIKRNRASDKSCKRCQSCCCRWGYRCYIFWSAWR